MDELKQMALRVEAAERRVVHAADMLHLKSMLALWIGTVTVINMCTNSNN